MRIIILFIALLSCTYIYSQIPKDISLSLKFPNSDTKSFNEVLAFPRDIILFENNYYVCDIEDGRIKVYNKTGKYIRSIGKKGKEDGDLIEPSAITINEHNGNLYVFDQGSSKIIIYNREGKFINALKIVGTIHSLYFHNNNLYALFFDSKKGFNIAVFNNNKIIKIFGEIFDHNILLSEQKIRIFYTFSDLIHYKDKLYVFSPFTPDIYTLSTTNSNNKTIKLKADDYQLLYQNNLNPKIVAGRTYTKDILTNMVTDGKYLYIYNNKDSVIKVFNFEGNNIGNIKINNIDNIHCRLMYKDNDKYIFCNLQEAAIEIYK